MIKQLQQFIIVIYFSKSFVNVVSSTFLKYFYVYFTVFLDYGEREIAYKGEEL
jgi:hypothetical protein